MERQINYKTMRIMVGLIAILLMPMVYWLANSSQPLTSISISYWTDAGDIFVGSLITVGFFLFAYNGIGDTKDWEFYLSKASCLFAVCIALFPTVGFSDADIAPSWASAVAGVVGLVPADIHNGAAVSLFTCLIVMMWFFSNRALRKGKATRAYIYRVISILMVVGIIVIAMFGREFGLNDTILWVEVWGLTLFGIGWLIAGSYKSEPVVQ